MEAGSTPNRVLVFARVRPASDEQGVCFQASQEAQAAHARQEQNGARAFVRASEDTHAVHACDENNSEQQFIFDDVFPPEATQEQVFSKVGLPAVRECLKGINCSILAYGQTGSGKTHSLLQQGEKHEDSGLLPRVVNEIFKHIANDPASSYKVEAAALSVYNEQVDDLLHPRHKAGDGHNIAVQKNGDALGLTWASCRNADELSSNFRRARAHLVYAHTQMNKASSRCHAIFQIRITKHSASGVSCSNLSIVDLAGSESIKKSCVEGMHLRETTAINKSLLAFGNVASALATRKKHVPFRDSKLTQLLSPCMGGNCKTSLLVCLSPAEEHVAETLRSLQFASRATEIEVHARMNRIFSCSNGTLGLEEATLQAIARAEQAEARAKIAEQGMSEWKERFQVASSEIASMKAANAMAEAGVQAAEHAASRWRCRCEEAMRHIESLEMKLAEALRDPQERSASKNSHVAPVPQQEDAQVLHLKLHQDEEVLHLRLQQSLDNHCNDVLQDSNFNLAREVTQNKMIWKMRHGILNSRPSSPSQLDTFSVNLRVSTRFASNRSDRSKSAEGRLKNKSEHVQRRSSLNSCNFLEDEFSKSTFVRSRTPTPRRPRFQAAA